MTTDTTLRPGPVANLEAAARDALLARQAVAVQHPLLALVLVYEALGLAEGDVVWVSALAPAWQSQAARAFGAVVEHVDVLAHNGNMSTAALAGRLAEVERTGRTPKVVVLTHMAGEPCELAGINHLANLHGFYMVEDATAALGARYSEFAIGSSRYSDFTLLALAGACAVVTTGRDDFADRLAVGRDRPRLGAAAAPSPEQAEAGCRLLAEVEAQLAARQAQAARYAARLAGLVDLPETSDDHRQALTGYAVHVAPERWAAVASAVGFTPDFGPVPAGCPQAAVVASTRVVLPLGGDDPDAVAEAVIAALK